MAQDRTYRQMNKLYTRRRRKTGEAVIELISNGLKHVELIGVILPQSGLGVGDPCTLGAGALLLLRLVCGIRAQQTPAFCAWSCLALPQHWRCTIPPPGSHEHKTFDNHTHVELATAGNMRQVGWAPIEVLLSNTVSTYARISLLGLRLTLALQDPNCAGRGMYENKSCGHVLCPQYQKHHFVTANFAAAPHSEMSCKSCCGMCANISCSHALMLPKDRNTILLRGLLLYHLDYKRSRKVFPTHSSFPHLNSVTEGGDDVCGAPLRC